MKKKTWSLCGRLLPGLPVVWVLAGQLVSAAALGNEQILKSFSSTDDGSRPIGGLTQDANGVLYGVTMTSGTGGGAVFAINPDGSGFKVLHDFGTSSNDATNPAAPLVLGVDGVLYGASGGGSNGMGAIFRLSPDGSGYKVLYSFGTLPQDGAEPLGPLVQTADGTLYGVTASGGATNLGTVFAIKPDGTGYQLLHTFSGSPNDGAWPRSGLMLGRDGALYGTTTDGGINNTIFQFGYGTVFKLNTDGSSFTLLHSFGGMDGASPQGVPFQGSDGTLYGTAGNVFRLNPNGSGFLVIPTTVNRLTIPEGGLVQPADGSLYGLSVGVAFGGKGGVFKVNPDGTGYAVVHVFGSFTGDGLEGGAPLLVGLDGALYGTTSAGGNTNLGTVFRITTASTPPPPFVLSIAPATGGGVHIGFVGIVGNNYGLYSSINLSDWILQGAVSNETGLVEFLDWNATKSPVRFYRAISMSP